VTATPAARAAVATPTTPATPAATAGPVAAAAPAAPVVAPIAAAQPGADSGPATPEAALRANWSNVKAEMGQAEVTRLLGEPTRKLTIDGRTVWYYVYPGIGTGSVFFTDKGRVSSRQWPFGWGW
jgi:hypothetical protein